MVVQKTLVLREVVHEFIIRLPTSGHWIGLETHSLSIPKKIDAFSYLVSDLINTHTKRNKPELYIPTETYYTYN